MSQHALPSLPTIVRTRVCVAITLLFVPACTFSCDRAPTATSSPAGRPDQVAPAIHREQRASTGDFTLLLSTSIDHTDLTVADRITLTFTCTTRAAAAVTLPDIAAQLGDFTVASAANSDRLDAAGNRLITLTIVLEPFLAGDRAIPSLTFQAADGGKTLTLKTEPLAAHVTSVADAADDARTPLEPAKSPVTLNLPATSRRTALWATIAGATIAIAAALGFAAIATSRRHKRQGSPAYIARLELQAVRAHLAESSTRADAAIACERLFRAFAIYLARTLYIPADTQPFAAIAPAVATSPLLSPANRNELNALLSDLERTRFAPDAASVPAVQSLLTRVDAFISQTSPSEVRT